jgi:hypothetical protein
MEATCAEDGIKLLNGADSDIRLTLPESVAVRN